MVFSYRPLAEDSMLLFFAKLFLFQPINNSMSEKKDITIASLEYARERLVNGHATDIAEFSNFLVAEGYLNRNEVGLAKTHLVKSLYEQIFSHQDKDFSLPVRFMNINSYLGLLDYEELQLAREDSKRAREEARLAIENAKEATILTEKALFWTKFAAISALLASVAQIAISFATK